MKEIIDYRLLVHQSAKELNEAVNRMIENGWQPYGSPFQDSSNEQTRLCQAMAKYTPNL